MPSWLPSGSLVNERVSGLPITAADAASRFAGNVRALARAAAPHPATATATAVSSRQAFRARHPPVISVVQRLDANPDAGHRGAVASEGCGSGTMLGFFSEAG